MNNIKTNKAQRPSKEAVIAALVELEYQKKYKAFELTMEKAKQAYSAFAQVLENEMTEAVRKVSAVSVEDTSFNVWKNKCTANYSIAVDLSPECTRLYIEYQRLLTDENEPRRDKILKDIKDKMKGRMTGTISEQANALLSDKKARADLQEILRQIQKPQPKLLLDDSQGASECLEVSRA